MAEKKLILGYWNLRGRAEPIRMLLSYLNIEFDEVRYSQGQSEEGQPTWFGKDKDALGLEFPNLPYLIDNQNGVKLTESLAILKYVCKLGNRKDLLGATLDDEVTIQLIAGVFDDTVQEVGQTLFRPTTTEEDIKKLFEDQNGKLMSKLGQLNTFFKAKKFIVGYFTVQDIRNYIFMVNLKLISEKFAGKNVIDTFENLKNYFESVNSIPEIQNYLKDPRFKDLPHAPAKLRFQY